MLKIKFDHSKSELQHSFGLSNDDMVFIKDIIIFEIINSYHQATSLYDKLDEVPNSLKSVSAIIEKCLKRCTSVEMAAYMLYNLDEAKNNIYTILEEYKDIDFKKELNKNLSGNEILDLLTKLSKKTAISSIISDIVKCSGSFESYINLKRKKNTDYSDINDIINKALNDKDEE